MKGKNLSGLEVTPAMLHVRHATKIASEVTVGPFHTPVLLSILVILLKTPPSPSVLIY